MDVQDRVVIVTGASEGIGEATARLLAREGAQVALVARSTGKLERLANELRRAFAYTVDMRDMAAVREMTDAVAKHYGRVDVLINNAGRGMHGTPVEQIPIDDFRELFELNIVGPLVAMQSVIPLMRQQGGGVIVNISSRLSKLRVPGVGAYASTKYMLNGLTLTAREELARDNIRVSLVFPGRTATRFQLNSMRAHADPQQREPQGDSPEMAAEAILRAIRTEEAEVTVS
jgi:short-subunit dehydrogenase